MNRLEGSHTETPPQQTYSYTKEQQVITSIALLILGYYAVSFFDAWPTTIKRRSYELTIRAVPSSFIYALQYIMTRLSRSTTQETLFRREDFGNNMRKEEAIQRMFGQTPIPNVLRRARALSGYDRVASIDGVIGPPGLGNWDNSCYQNSVLQGLASLPAFQAYIHRSLQLCQKAGTSGTTTAALAVFLDQLADSSCQKQFIWTPNILKSMDSWQQQDAQEYFSNISDAVEKEALRYTKVLLRHVTPGFNNLPSPMNKNNTAFIDDASGPVRKFLQAIVKSPLDGMQAQALECQTCGFSEGISLTQFNCLTLNLGIGGHCHLEDLLDEYTEPEMIDGVECDECTKVASVTQNLPEVASESNTPVTADTKQIRKKPVLRTKAKQITIGRLPKDLVIHINRSIFDDYGNQRKNTSLVRFPSRLEFVGKWCAPIDEEINRTQAVYQLKCTVTHQGRHDNGHYVAYGKREKGWYCFNDEIVTNLSEEDVLARGNVFMLFYEALDHMETMSADEYISAEDEEAVPVGVDSTAASSSDTDVVEEPVNPPPIIQLPAMRTASGPQTQPDQENNLVPATVDAV